MIRITFIFFLFIFSTITALSQTVENQISKINTGSGLHTADFKTKLGVLKIYLPSDLTVTEPASGTVSFKKHKSGVKDNIGINDVFTSYKLIVENRPVELTGNVFFIEVPINLPTGVLSVSLRNSEGKVVNRAFFPVRLTKRGNLPRQVGNPANFRLPVTSRSGQPANINGNFDGNLTNASVSISGTQAKILAESKKQLVFLTPSSLQGAKVLTLKEGDVEVKNPFTVLYVVKVGQEQPEIYADNNDNQISTANKGNEILIESNNQTGEIDLNANSELNPVNQLPSTTSAPELESNDENIFGPRTSNLSKPLEIDPDELQKLRKSSPRVFSNQDLPELYGLTELNTKTQAPDNNIRQIKEEPEQLKEQPKQVKVIPKKDEVAESNLKSGIKDISEIKPQIDEQLAAQFVPLDSKSQKRSTEVIEPEQKEPIEDLKIVESDKTTSVTDPAIDYLTTVANAKQVVKDDNLKKEVTPEKDHIKQDNLKATVAQADLDQETSKEKEKPINNNESKELKDIKVNEKIEITEEIKIEEVPDLIGPNLTEEKATTVPGAKNTESSSKKVKVDKEGKTESEKKQTMVNPDKDIKKPETKSADDKKVIKTENKNNKPKKPTELSITEKIELTEEIKIVEEQEFVGPKQPEKETATVKKADKKAEP
ncbi:MAG: hypothetical protein ACR2NW_07335, partial [Thermodesulfobacteriota bacterium]